MAMRTVGASAGVPSSVRSMVVSSSDWSTPARRGHSRTTPKAKHATGTATRARPSTAPVPSASAEPTGPASSVHRPRAKIAPSTNRHTASRSARWPASCRPAASRDRATIPGSAGAAFARDVVVLRGAGLRAGFFLDRDVERRRVVVAGIPRT